MPISSILKKASSYILGYTDETSSSELLEYEENETLFCKNNVCVHPPALAREESDVIHHSGYLTLCTKTFIDQHNFAKRPTLFLTWIPNSTLRKCPAPLENCSPLSQIKSRMMLHSRNSVNKEDVKKEGSNNNNTQIQIVNTTNPFLDNYIEPEEYALSQQKNKDNLQAYEGKSDYSETASISSSSDYTNYNDCCYSHSNVNEQIILMEEDEHKEIGILNEQEDEEAKELSAELEPLLSQEGESDQKILTHQISAPTSTESTVQMLKNYKKHRSMTSVNITIANPNIVNLEVSASPDDDAVKKQIIRSLSVSSADENNPNWMTAEMYAYKHNLTFPDSVSSSPVVNRKNNQSQMKCRRFSVDLSQMRALRLFFNDEQCTSGQLVIASRESQYKILHFHHGGLDHLAQVLHQWHCLLHNIKVTPGQDETNLTYRQFMVCRPEVHDSELHPEEGKVPKITTEYFYGQLLNEKGQIEDDLQLKKCVFFGGLEKNLRKTIWPFLLHCYSTSSTFNDRIALANLRKQEYEEITKRRLYSMSPEEQAQFWRNVQSVIEKDVVRTDRGNPFFAGEGNANIEIMRNILLNYASYNPGMSYTQGMSDLLAPVLCELKNESETFWCFVGLMQRAIFVCTPNDNDIDEHLQLLRELIRLIVPKFYEHLLKHNDAMELLFCHRWILLCFKREFTEAVAIRIWEACWANYLTDYFHLFVCLAIISVYSEDVIAQDLRTDEMLLHFSSLAMYMDGQLILRKARGLLHQFRQLPKIPCTLTSLCRRCGPGIWDSGHRPSVECIGHDEKEKCALAEN
ncbi:CLUMA_CG016378, isoform A [Clunio marinus]|uniref:CLUMA_CG016378, isoform A n=1 Tax=Clunio marinus TaxID=568069 RepID=A0A1J1IU37_9DIPT|nr:CLUMA_CG016378, isoform A [Clunio marinus]